MVLLKGSYSKGILKQWLIHILYVRFLDAEWECLAVGYGLLYFFKLKPTLKLVSIPWTRTNQLPPGAR